MLCMSVPRELYCNCKRGCCCSPAVLALRHCGAESSAPVSLSSGRASGVQDPYWLQWLGWCEAHRVIVDKQAAGAVLASCEVSSCSSWHLLHCKLWHKPGLARHRSCREASGKTTFEVTVAQPLRIRAGAALSAFLLDSRCRTSCIPGTPDGKSILQIRQRALGRSLAGGAVIVIAHNWTLLEQSCVCTPSVKGPDDAEMHLAK